MAHMIQLARALVNRTGFDLIRTRNQHESLAWHLKNVLLSRDIDCVLDVGANAGQYGQFLRELGYEGHIVSFEPVRSVFEKLQQSAAKDAKWLTYNFALGDTAGAKAMNVYQSTVFSSFLTATDYSKGIWTSLNNVSPETVEVFKLDDVFSEIEQRTGAKRFYLKMDTQGFDRNVFRGAQGSLHAVLALQSEIPLISVYEGMPSTYEFLNEFHAAGFFISGMYPVNRDRSLAVIEYDCVMVRKT